MKRGKEMSLKSRRLVTFEKNLSVIDRYRIYLERELSKVRLKESKVREKISKEKQAINLLNRAKKLRSRR